MKKFLLFSFFLVGCGQVVSQAQLPPHVRLSAEAGLMALATPLSEDIFVTADHAWQKAGALTWQDQDLQVLARDFERNLIFMKIDEWAGAVATWTDQALAVGAEVYWVDGLKSYSGTILSLSEDSKDWFVVASRDQDFLPGSPVFNMAGDVLGILMYQDQVNGTFEGVRSDRVLDFYEQIQ